jgi:hypothetical protein
LRWQVDDGSVFLVTGLERDLRQRRKLAWSLERDEVLVAQLGGQVSEGLHDVIGIGRHDAAARLVNDGWPEGICAGLYDVEDRFGVQHGLAQPQPVRKRSLFVEALGVDDDRAWSGRGGFEGLGREHGRRHGGT